MFGPIIFVPLSKLVGINATLFWSGIGLVGVTIWGAKMTEPAQYIPFVVSRGLAGFFGTACQVLGNEVIINVFFLHQRGKAFAFYSTCFILGAVAGQSLGGFVIQHTSWAIQLWYTIAPQGVSLLLLFLFLEDTSFNRDGTHNESTSRSWFSKRLASILPGLENKRPASLSEVVRSICDVEDRLSCANSSLIGSYNHCPLPYHLESRYYHGRTLSICLFWLVRVHQ